MFNFKIIGVKPNYLLESDFDTWFNDFNEVFNNYRLTNFPFNHSLSIEFSYVSKKKGNGFYSINDIKDLIRQKWNTNKEIESILKKIKNYEDYKNDGTYEILAGKIRNNNANTNYEDINRKINQWFGNIYHKYNVLGEYIHYQKKIILYTKNIEKYAKDNSIFYDEAFGQVIMHELFHAYHYKDNNEELIRRYDYTSEVVKESLASYFEYCWCETFGIKTADSIKRSWTKNSVLNYPYSGAYNIYSNLNFKKVYETSLVDMDAALRMLLKDDDFYAIKNAIEIRNEFINIPTKSKPIKTTTKDVPQVFVVKNAKSFNGESKENYLFAPDIPYYSAMNKVQCNDIILHIFKNMLHAISIAKGTAYKSLDSHNRHEEGKYIDSAYTIFDSPIYIGNLKNHKHYPNKQGDPHYILSCDDLDIVMLILDEALIMYPNNTTLLLVKKILS